MTRDNRRSMKALWLLTRVAGSFSATLSGPLAARLWFTPWRIPASERVVAKQRKWLEPTSPVSFQVAGRRIAGFTAGDGPIVLLVHGWGERAASLGAFIAPLLKDGFRVVGIDLPAHGDTPGAQTDLLVNREALLGVVDQLGPIHAVIGHSMGGTITAFALDAGLDPDRVVLIAPAVRLERAVGRFGSMLKLPPKALVGLRRTIDRRYGADVWERLAIDRLARGYDVPALIVHDSDDDQVDPADVEQLVRAWPGARSLVTRRLGHVRPTRDEGVIAEIRAFVGERDVRRDLVRDDQLASA